MTSNLKQTNGWAHNGVFYTTEREALLHALAGDKGAPTEVHKATLYGDGSVIVMDNANIVIDRFVDRFAKLTPTEYESAPEQQGQFTAQAEPYTKHYLFSEIDLDNLKAVLVELKDLDSRHDITEVEKVTIDLEFAIQEIESTGE